MRKRDGSGVVTFDPNASETIDALTTIRVYQESFLIWTDGTAWYSQGRPKGWVPLAEVGVASAVASVDFSVGFGDPEFRDMEFRYEGLVPSTASPFAARVSKSGAFVTTGNYSQGSYVVTGANAIASTGANAYLDLSVNNINTNRLLSGRFLIENFRATTAALASAEWSNGWDVNIALGRGYEALNAAAIDGIRFYFTGGNIASGTINQRGYRP